MFFLVFLSLIFSITFYNFYWKRRKLPPGPTPWPLLGNILSLFFNPPGVKCYINWRKKFGNVYTYWLGELPVVCVADYQLINETFIKDGEAYAGRPDFNDFYEIWKFGSHGVVFIDGDCWREQRRFTLQIFRDFGLGKNLMQEKILVEVQALITHIKKDLEVGVVEHDVAKYIDVTVGSVINSIVFGSRLSLDDDVSKFYEIKDSVNTLVDMFGRPDVMMLWKNMKTLGKLPYFSGLCEQIKRQRNKLFDYLNGFIAEHKEEIDFSIDSEPKDYVEAFLREQKKREKEGEEHHFTQIQLVNMCFDLWLAGQETTAKTLAWAIVYLIHNPDVQKNITEELDREIGTDRIVDLSDKNRLHYLNAAINEIQRLTNLVPQNIIRRTLKDVTIDGHFIPKGTCILPQISVILEDEEIFPEPYKFKPERFLDESGRLKKVDEFIPFSVGKRQCLGESLARMELYLFLANLCNQFKFSSIPGKMPSLYKQCSGAVGTQPFVCSIEQRKHNN